MYAYQDVNDVTPLAGLHQKSLENRLMRVVLQPRLNTCQIVFPGHGLLASGVAPPCYQDILIVGDQAMSGGFSAENGSRPLYSVHPPARFLPPLLLAP